MLYLIRNKEDRKPLGMFYANSPELLLDLLDEQVNPYSVEFRRMDHTPGGGIWFEEIADESHGENNEYQYPSVDHITFDENSDAYLYDAYQEYIKGKDDPESEWLQFTKNSHGDIRYTKHLLLDACDAIEIIKEIREGDFKP